jgi:hypothetical protein
MRAKQVNEFDIYAKLAEQIDSILGWSTWGHGPDGHSYEHYKQVINNIENYKNIFGIKSRTSSQLYRNIQTTDNILVGQILDHPKYNAGPGWSSGTNFKQQAEWYGDDYEKPTVLLKMKDPESAIAVSFNDMKKMITLLKRNNFDLYDRLDYFDDDKENYIKPGTKLKVINVIPKETYTLVTVTPL